MVVRGVLGIATGVSAVKKCRVCGVSGPSSDFRHGGQNRRICWPCRKKQLRTYNPAKSKRRCERKASDPAYAAKIRKQNKERVKRARASGTGYLARARLLKAILGARSFCCGEAAVSAACQSLPLIRFPALRQCKCGQPTGVGRGVAFCPKCREASQKANDRRRNKGKLKRRGKRAEELLAKQKGRCFYCLKKLRNDYHVDHFIPRAKGGSNDWSNLRIACPTCNIAKSDKPPEEFLGVLLC